MFTEIWHEAGHRWTYSINILSPFNLIFVQFEIFIKRFHSQYVYNKGDNGLCAVKKSSDKRIILGETVYQAGLKTSN